MGVTDCRSHVSITPYNEKLVPEEIRIVDISSFDPNLLVCCNWPPTDTNFRIPEGGTGGDIVNDSVTLSWKQNQLIYPFSSNPKPLAEKLDETEILYLASFLAYLDGQIAYVPSINNKSYFLILVESPVAEIHAIKFPPNHAVIIDPYVKHSIPIAIKNELEFDAWHRKTNGSLSSEADPAGVSKIIVNLTKIDRVKPIKIRKIGAISHNPSMIKKLEKNFSSDLRTLEIASPNEIAQYGLYIPNASNHSIEIKTLPWPGSNSSYPSSSLLEQDFLVTWRMPLDDSPDKFELEFEGLNGSFIGEKGRPGVEYNTELGIYSADLLMARPDGNFYIKPINDDSMFAMALALPNNYNGNPIKETLKVFIFKQGSALELNPYVWHSVPILLADSVTGGVQFQEIVSATNANLVINIKEETGSSIKFSKGL